MKKLLIVITMLTVFMLQPVGGNAASLDKINKDLASAKKQIEQAEKSASDAEKQKESVNAKKLDVQKSLQTLMKELDDVVVNLTRVQTQVDTKEEELQQAGLDLEEAEQRVESRDQLLQQRLRLMYENGFVSYLDVLLSSTSFTDFIDRFDSLQSILSQDRNILEQHKIDKELVIVKKAEVETALDEVKTMYAKLQKYKTQLVKKEEEKEVMIASLNQEIEELEEISEEQEQALMALAKKVSDLEKEKKKKNKIKNPYTGGKLGMPIRDNYRVSSNFGYRVHPISGKKKLHAGIDFAAPQGTDIFAAEAGVVLVAQVTSGYGNTVIIDHGNGLWTLYGHIRNNGIKVDKGEVVKKGQKVAEVGSTGQSTGPHLHFEVRQDQVAINPSSYLK